MGIYDRDYYREQQPGFSLRAPSTIVGTIIAINVVVFLANGLLTPKDSQIANILSVRGSTLFQPWMWWQFVTYGFVHDPSSLTHILFNMLQLWFLGRSVEEYYGRWEFLRIYLVMLVLGSVAWAAGSMLSGVPNVQLLGASGAVSGVVMLFVLHNPHATLILFPIPIPIKAWVIGVLLVVGNIYGATLQESNVAFGVHLVGIGFAFLYVRNRWSLRWLSFGNFGLPGRGRRPKLRIHDPGRKEEALSKEVDRILEKIHQEGEDSLTRKERRTLESASREYQKKRQ